MASATAPSAARRNAKVERIIGDPQGWMWRQYIRRIVAAK
jgi:hypothetical protein